jgi:hypothetical protein
VAFDREVFASKIGKQISPKCRRLSCFGQGFAAVRGLAQYLPAEAHIVFVYFKKVFEMQEKAELSAVSVSFGILKPDLMQITPAASREWTDEFIITLCLASSSLFILSISVQLSIAWF